MSTRITLKRREHLKGFESANDMVRAVRKSDGLNRPRWGQDVALASTGEQVATRYRRGLQTALTDNSCKFEWTRVKFHEYYKEAVEWGYTVDASDIGRVQDADEWEEIQRWQPLPLYSIGDIAKSRMEDLRESFLELKNSGTSRRSPKLVEVKDADSPEERRLAQGFLLHSPIDPPLSFKINWAIPRERDLWRIYLVNARNHPNRLTLARARSCLSITRYDDPYCGFLSWSSLSRRGSRLGCVGLCRNCRRRIQERVGPLWPTSEILVDEEGREHKSVWNMSADWIPEEEYACEDGNVSGYCDENENSDYARTMAGEGNSANAGWSLDLRNGTLDDERGVELATTVEHVDSDWEEEGEEGGHHPKLLERPNTQRNTRKQHTQARTFVPFSVPLTPSHTPQTS
ncbi:hypothetical protein F5051DRAFT_433050 [Lentinula edodes]|nr:hypothetical protein F5051DRAFT_433050 [Lentinula edodes]